jgi:methylmalonyl-CoA mutase N-terminal domain/subunit
MSEDILKQWERTVLAKALRRAPETKEEFCTVSGLPVPRIGLPDELDAKYMETLGLPGVFPFGRGIRPSMYRSRHWTMRQYAGSGSAQESNAMFKRLLNQGGTGLSVAFDLPTQIGLDSDHALAAAEIGKVGVAIDTLADMEALFDGIDLGAVSTSMTINAPAAIVLAMYVTVADQQGVSRDQVRGTVQNDILKEYLARGTYIFPPRPSLKLAAELIAWCSRELPKFNPVSVSGYHIREAGSTAPQEVAFTLANAWSYLDAAMEFGMTVDDVAPNLSFFFNAASDLFEEVAKFRAARRIWAKLTKERYAPQKAESMMLRFHAQTAGHTLAAQQVDNNIARVTLQVLSAVLGGAQSIHANAKDEALSLPTPDNARTALRIQQIIAYESGVADSVDPLGGSYFVESMTDAMESEVMRILDNIEQVGGAVKATESGTIERWIEEAAYRQQKAIENRERIVVGVNRFEGGEELTTGGVIAEIPDGVANQVKRLQEVRIKRSPSEARRCIEKLRSAASARENLMPHIFDAVRSYCSIGEMCGALRDVYGEHGQTNTRLG